MLEFSSRLEHYYEALLRNKMHAFIVYPTRNIELVQSIFYKQSSYTHVYPGSWNPITDAHKAIFESIKIGQDDQKFFEISIERMDKEFLPLTAEPTSKAKLNSLTARVKQFWGLAPVLVNRASRFIEKAGVLKDLNPVFHIGIDTANRMLDDYGHVGIMGINASFIVYDRKIEGKIASIDDWPNIPLNFKKGPQIAESLMGIASSDIRRKWEGPE